MIKHATNAVFSAVCCLATTLPGCGPVKKLVAYSSDIGGEVVPPPEQPFTAGSLSMKVYDHYQKSFTNCEDYERRLVAANTGLNAGTDFLSLVLSAIGAIITPVATTHLFSGGAAISTGLKSTIATDVTSGALTNVTIAFNKQYFEPMTTLSKDIEEGAHMPRYVH